MNNSGFKYLDLDNKILSALEKLKYISPTKIQKEVIPLALEKIDIIAKSQTGSGKTAAFAIPLCESIDVEENNPQALVLTPTRELAVQVKEEITYIGRFKRIRSEAIFGKQPIERQTRELKQRVHIIVGTPGRTLDHINKGNIILNDIKYLVIDEADKMLNMGFIEQVEAVIEKLPINRVTMLFSATIPEKILNLCDKYMKNPKLIETNAEMLTVEKTYQYYYEIDEREKFNFLTKLIYTNRPDSCIIFCNTKDTVNWLFQKMDSINYDCSKLHGGMEQKDRLEVMNNFKRGALQFLIATDVAARGIDIEDISLVVNYDVPVEKESYVHRIGRTGRAGKEGIAITLVTQRELKLLNQIEKYLDFNIPMGEIPSEQEIELGKKKFDEKQKGKVNLKVEKSSQLEREVTKVYIKAGKNKKIRPGDIVGAIINIKGILAEDIGIIDIQDNISYVDILNGKGNIVLRELPKSTIKGKRIIVQRAQR
jgi:superfamily II DNA/RNA helicase